MSHKTTVTFQMNHVSEWIKLLSTSAVFVYLHIIFFKTLLQNKKHVAKNILASEKSLGYILLKNAQDYCTLPL